MSVFAPFAEIALPTLVLPVKLTTLMSGDSTRRADPPRPGLSLNTLTTPRGRSAASEMTWLNTAFVWAVLPGSLMTVVAPAASAGASERTVSTSGELNGAMIPATPMADRVTTDSRPGIGSSARP